MVENLYFRVRVAGIYTRGVLEEFYTTELYLRVPVVQNSELAVESGRLGSPRHCLGQETVGEGREEEERERKEGVVGL